MMETTQREKGAPGLTYGMVGGGEGAFIGDVHRKSIGLDGRAGLAAGVFSRDYQNTLRTGESLGIDKNRLYKTFSEMADTESEIKGGIDFVSIVTPNNTHFPIARAFLEKGIHVICDKPLTLVPEEARELKKIAGEKDLLFGVTYTYTGYPLIKHLKEMISRGDLGVIRFINAEYPQEWLTTLKEKTGQKQAAWRADPVQTGKSNCVGDIGSHIENMVSYLTGFKICALCARLDTHVKERVLDDNASILVNYCSGATGLYWSSQIALGYDNGLRIRIFGSKASAEWCQENPNYLKIGHLEKPVEIISRGRDNIYPHAETYSRVPAGHPEGYFEAFANIYSTFIQALKKKKSGQSLTSQDLDFPGVDDGIQGVEFINKCVESSQNGAVWLEL